jgi:hypothetical protein
MCAGPPGLSVPIDAHFGCSSIAIERQCIVRAMYHRPSMLDERRALGFTYDATTDIAKVAFEHTRLHAQSKTLPSAAKGSLLLDARGFLVGVDLGTITDTRSVVLLGRHEDVASTVDSTIVVMRVGNADGYEVQIPNAKAQVRGSEKNPYLP